MNVYDIIFISDSFESSESDDQATRYFTDTYYEAETTIRDDAESLTRHCNLLATVEAGTLDIWYDYAGDYYFCSVNEAE
jgi:hypothetical protein